MACFGNPDILIVDKPTVGLDLVCRRQVGVAFFIGYVMNSVALGMLVDVIHYSLSLSLSLSLFFCYVLSS